MWARSHDGGGHAAVPRHVVVHAAQDVIDPLPRSRGAARAAPGAFDGDEAAVITVLADGYPWRKLLQAV
jgi:hypothetical protein